MGGSNPTAKNTMLRQIPSVEEILASARVRQLVAQQPRWAVVEAIREVLAARRERALTGGLTPEALHALVDPDAIQTAVEEATLGKTRPSLRPVINASGVVIHTNLGRAPIAASALRAVERAARGYSNLELDLTTGNRGSRQAHVEQLLCAMTGAEAAFVVNNNAAAVFLSINTLARGREVLISRGELVEIGDSFRIPDVMTSGGARLREVGTTNRTHLADYEEALGPETALILKVHRSNFKILGFTADVDAAALVGLGRSRGLPVMEDLGSGALLDLSSVGLRREPLAADAIRAGVDLVCFSGDKLLGGPQAGILVGRRDIVARLRRNPLARTVRTDKLCVAGLEATLRLARDPERAWREIPVLRMLSLSPEAVGARAEAFAASLRAVVSDVRCAIEDGASEVGGGALPLQALPTRVLAVQPERGSVDAIETRLRSGDPPAVVRVQEGRIVLDLRTVAPDEEPGLLAALTAALADGGRRGA